MKKKFAILIVAGLSTALAQTAPPAQSGSSDPAASPSLRGTSAEPGVSGHPKNGSSDPGVSGPAAPAATKKPKHRKNKASSNASKGSSSNPGANASDTVAPHD